MQKGLIGDVAFGMRVIEVPEEYTLINKQVRFPRSKKQRIKKKWRKDKRNWKKVRHFFMVKGGIAVDKVLLEHIKTL